MEAHAAREALLVDVRRALGSCEWEEAFLLLSEADAVEHLDADLLEALGDAAWWTGRAQEAIEAKERAFVAYLEAGNSRRAARVALQLFDRYLWMGKRSVANGWLQQAGSLLEDEPDCPERGHLELWRAVAAYYGGHYETTIELADRAIEFGAHFADQTLGAFATCAKGDAMVALGRIEEGMSLMEQAAAAALAGGLELYEAGHIYCILLAACESVGDWRRASEWVDVATRWCERMGLGHFHGQCRLRQARFMGMRGAFDQAEEEARRAWHEMRDLLPSYAGIAMHEIGMLRLLRGDLQGAAEAFEQGHELGISPDAGMAALHLAKGDLQEAAAAIRRALPEENRGDPQRARFFLPLQAEIAEATRDLEALREAVAELEATAAEHSTEALRATAAAAHARLHLAEVNGEEALRAARNAFALWQELNLPYQVARAQLLVGRAFRLLGDEEGAEREFRTAQRTFDSMGAEPERMRCDQLLAGEDPADMRERTVRAFMFTDIAGSTRLIEAIGDQAWVDLRRWHDQTVRRLVDEHRGQEVEHTGDGFFMTFPDQRSAASCAVVIQETLAEHRRVHGFAPQVRIGVHCGEATREGTTYSGQNVHIAARVTSLAEGDRILVTEEVIEAGIPFPTGDWRDVSLAGVDRPVRVAEIKSGPHA